MQKERDMIAVAGDVDAQIDRTFRRIFALYGTNVGSFFDQVESGAKTEDPVSSRELAKTIRLTKHHR